MLFAKKALGVEICPDGIRMALAGGGEKALRLDAYCVMPFPPETVKFSTRELNILNNQAFVATVRETYLRLLTKSRRISVSLPDSTGRVILMDVETRFKSRDEGADVIRWKLKKTFPFDINEAHLDYQVLEERESGAVSLLVSIISKQIVTQYEDLIIEAGLEPNYIDFTTFNLFRLFSNRMQLVENASLMTFYGGVLTMLIFFSGVLTFYRSKEIHGGMQEANRVYREINSSLLVYQDKVPNSKISEVFCVASPDEIEAFRAIVADATGIEPVLLDVERAVTCRNELSLEKKTLHSLTAALGASVRNL
jgi:type IV pilus assembly protein PilM